MRGLILPAVLPGEDKALCQQNITQAETKPKEVCLFDNNINEPVHKFENFIFDTFPVHTISIHCEGMTKFYDDNDNVFKLLRGPIYTTQDKANITYHILTRNTLKLCLVNASIHHVSTVSKIQ